MKDSLISAKYAKVVAAAEESGDQPLCKALRGKLSAKYLLIAPSLSEEEYNHGVPFSGTPAVAFHQVLQEEAGLDTNADFLVLPVHPAGLSLTRRNSLATAEFVAEVIRDKRGAVCVGKKTYQFIFNSGHKPPETIIGRAVRLPEFSNKNVFTFPDLAPFNIPLDGATRREIAAVNLFEWELRKHSQALAAVIKSWA